MMLVRIARSTAHCRAGLVATLISMPTVHGSPAAVGAVMLRAGRMVISPRMSSATPAASTASWADSETLSTRSVIDSPLVKGRSIWTTARAHCLE